MKTVYNNYYYNSRNELGLIYITEFQVIEKCNEHIKEAAFAEYPFGQNNFGLLNEIYFNKKEEAEHFYKRSSEHQFSLAPYNLGHQREKEGKREESIEYYKLASANEDSPLIFHQNLKNFKFHQNCKVSKKESSIASTI